MNLQLALRQELLRDLHPLHAESELRLATGNLTPVHAELQGLPDGSVGERMTGRHVRAWEILDLQKCRVFPAVGRGQTVGADPGRGSFRDRIQDILELVGGLLADLRPTVGVSVVKDLVCTETLDEVEIMWGTSRDHLQARTRYVYQ